MRSPATDTGATSADCRFCGAALRQTFVDLGMSPLCESFLSAEQLNQMEPFYPLHARVCGECFLVQVEEYVRPERIFTEYAYFSSYSDSWLRHARAYTDMITGRLGLTAESQVIELGSNDGYLLQFFVGKGIPVLGIEPAANVAEAAERRGVRTAVKMFGRETAHDLVRAGIQADLLIGNNVLAQVPDLNGFVAGMELILRPGGVITMEFPHLARLIEENQFDTIYHEHFSYFSLTTVERIFAAHGLRIFAVEEISTHGGSLRIYAAHAEDAAHPLEPPMVALREREAASGLQSLERYAMFTEQVHETKRRLLEYLIGLRRKGKVIAGYGAPGKGNTLLNYCGIRTDFIDYVVDRNSYKQGKFLPGTHIPIFAPERIKATQPDYVLILPWNLKDEIMAQESYIRAWNGRFIVPIPDVTIHP
jgi:2-polyprenyl-3-methyl-5-hydroxy-6-metoxy-1,4-benzoquinol methylase